METYMESGKGRFFEGEFLRSKILLKANGDLSTIVNKVGLK
jgi:hypothetical protein